jgi:hypothetical protein
MTGAGVAGWRDDGHDDERDRRVLLDLLSADAGHRTGSRPAAHAAGHVRRLHRGEPAPDDRRRGDRDGDRGQHGDQREGSGEPKAEAHRRAPR